METLYHRRTFVSIIIKLVIKMIAPSFGLRATTLKPCGKPYGKLATVFKIDVFKKRSRASLLNRHNFLLNPSSAITLPAKQLIKQRQPSPSKRELEFNRYNGCSYLRVGAALDYPDANYTDTNYTVGIEDSKTMLAMLRRFQYRIIRIPIVGPAIRRLVRQYMEMQFTNSGSYWERRYARGGDSGAGSYNKLAEYKAEIVNDFVAENQITSVIEFGCGDGNQLLLANYEHYIGYDISPVALARCRELFKGDSNKSFHSMQEHTTETADLTLSLDVIYHLTEDEIFDAYMHTLFAASRRFVLIYSSNQIEQDDIVVAHVKHRLFTAWVDLHKPDWKLIRTIPNRYSFAKNQVTGSFADFYIYEKPH